MGGTASPTILINKFFVILSLSPVVGTKVNENNAKLISLGSKNSLRDPILPEPTCLKN
jgi:hypothetical protein